MYFPTAAILLSVALAGGATANILARSVAPTTTLIYTTPHSTTPTLIIYPTWTKNTTTLTYPPGTGTSIRPTMNSTVTYNTTSIKTSTQKTNTTVTRTICDQQNSCSVTVSIGPTLAPTATITATGTGTGVTQPTMTPFISGVGRIVASGGWAMVVLCGIVLLL